MGSVTATIKKDDAIRPWSRIAILLFFLALGLVLSYLITGSFVPTNANEALVFQGSLLLIVLGSAVLEHKFTKPADSAVNSLVGIITLVPVYTLKPSLLWWSAFGYCAVVFVLSTLCVAVSSGHRMSSTQTKIAELTYRPAVLLGKARVLYSVMFLFGLLSFYSLQSNTTLALLLYWGIFVVIWPLGLPELLSSFSKRNAKPKAMGKLLRTDEPNIVRVVLDPDVQWSRTRPNIYQQSDGKQIVVIPLYSQIQEEGLLGTGICAGLVPESIPRLVGGHLYDGSGILLLSDAEIAERLSGDPTSTLVGFVVEGSSIADIRFETLDSDSCRQGMVVWCPVSGERIYYQITNGMTDEETLHTDRHGFQIAVAAQLGHLNTLKGFTKHEWLPPMNTPVFAIPKDFGSNLQIGAKEDFQFGSIPGTNVKVVGPLLEYMDSHTAILGVTGSGKTELAFDVIREAAKNGIKVVCIDLTSQYSGRLAELNPINLSITPKTAGELGQKLFEVETGQYGAGNEKKALKQFSDKLRTDVTNTIKAFLTDKNPAVQVGLIQLDEISNTQATLFVTELFMTCLLNFAKDNAADCPRILIVVEEAHTVMPEPSTMGLSDFASKGLVAKTSQIALQGRKYGVGLLVIAQRTATVSKSVLTQCNTVISFTCFDDTSLGFLKNVFGAAHTELIPNLRPLTAVIFGKGVRSERPIVVQIPFNEEKSKASYKQAAKNPAIDNLDAAVAAQAEKPG